LSGAGSSSFFWAASAGLESVALSSPLDCDFAALSAGFFLSAGLVSAELDAGDERSAGAPLPAALLSEEVLSEEPAADEFVELLEDESLRSASLRGELLDESLRAGALGSGGFAVTGGRSKASKIELGEPSRAGLLALPGKSSEVGRESVARTVMVVIAGG
jgi:hypothetical protein